MHSFRVGTEVPMTIYGKSKAAITEQVGGWKSQTIAQGYVDPPWVDAKRTQQLSPKKRDPWRRNAARGSEQHVSNR